MALKDLLFILDDLMNRLYESLGEGGKIRRIESSTELLLLFGAAFFMCFLLAGGPYVLVYQPSLLFTASNTFQATFVSTSQLEQGGIEGLIIGMMYLMGIGGLYWLYTSSRGGRPSSIVSIAAIVLVVIATVLLYLIGSWKH